MYPQSSALQLSFDKNQIRDVMYYFNREWDFQSNHIS